MKQIIILFSLVLFFVAAKAQAPVNDNCANATVINISNSGYGLGVFTSSNSDLTNATAQVGENFYSTIQSAGQTSKTVWFKFTLPTPRRCTLSLKQPTPLIAGNNAGFTVYLANSCFPTELQADSALLAAQTVFGFSTNPCLKAGEYLVQVSANNSANGPIFIELNLDEPDPASYDNPADAYQFGVVNTCETYVDVSLGCYSLNNASEVCAGLGSNYSQSAWFTFTTDSYFDYTGFSVRSPNGYFLNDMVYGYRLYRGDARTTPIGSLVLVDGCNIDTAVSYEQNFNGWQCDFLQTNTVYSLQLLFSKDVEEPVRIYMHENGSQQGTSPQPTTTGIAAADKLGVLPLGITNRTNYFACNTRLSVNSCGNANPAGGVLVNNPNLSANWVYDLAVWYTFELSQSSTLQFNLSGQPYYYSPYVRIFNQDVNTNCNNIDTANIQYDFFSSGRFDCVPAGKYTMQVLGTTNGYNATCANFNNLGNSVDISIDVQSLQASNRFALNNSGRVDTLRNTGNQFLPLLNDTVYASVPDTFGCNNTVLPAGTLCQSEVSKASYVEFQVGDADGNGVADSGYVSIATYSNYSNSNFWSKLYKGDASALAQTQNAFNYPDKINNLSAATECFGINYCGLPRACVTPGIYTLVNTADSTMVGKYIYSEVSLNTRKTQFRSAALAENMGSILDSMSANNSTTFLSQTDIFTCIDNPQTIGGLDPCDGYNGNDRTKLIYRQFFLSQPVYGNIQAVATINGCQAYPIYTLFYGKATDGIGTLTPVGNQWTCTYSASTEPCLPLAAGWYTIVTYGEGPTYNNPLNNYNSGGGYGGDIGMLNNISITVTTSPNGPKYNRPAVAAIDTLTNQPFQIRPAINSGTVAYPKTDTTYYLYQDFFDCTTDTPFSQHPIVACGGAQFNRVAYYVFTLTEESYIRLQGLAGSGFIVKLYQGNARTTPGILSGTPVQPCVTDGDFMQLCRILSGTYTLVIFVADNYNGSSISPALYIDKTGYSRFDHARNAYDFGVVNPDSTWYDGKVGDVNPLNATRAPSNDFFYCTTGAQTTDPPFEPCYTITNPNVYNTPQTNNDFYNDATYPGISYNNFTRRNLWYTFVLDGGGTCKIKVNAKTQGKDYYVFTVYKSDVDGNLPFNTVVSTGQVDSTENQGLDLVVSNAQSSSWCIYYPNEVSFYRDPCFAQKERYYVVVENIDHAYFPSSQIEVEILWDSISATPVKYDFLATANVINGLNQTAPPYTNTPLPNGVSTGAKDYFTCATVSANNPLPNCTCNPVKNIWYKINIGKTGILKHRYVINDVDEYYPSNCQAVLYRSVIPGDTTSNGLVDISSSNYNYYYDAANNLYWFQSCVSAGTYYLQMTGCNRQDETVQPVVWFEEQDGDFCTSPISGTLNGPGALTLSATINCHTIGEGFGEDGSNMACLIPSGSNVNDFKSTWFRFDVPVNDTFDVTPVINNLTNLTAGQVRYRLLFGTCGALNTGSCFVNANTVNTFECLTNGSYYIQVVMPNNNQFGQVSEGEIEMTINATQSLPGCNPINTCFALAIFDSESPCNTDSVNFLNQSTFGSDIAYLWKFGYNNQTDTSFAPSFLYPPVTGLSQDYTVTLIVTNTLCGDVDSITKTITVYKKPSVNLGNDTSLCQGTSYMLDATTHTGTDYLWFDGSTNAQYDVTYTGQFYVEATYNGCTVYDTVNVTFDPVPYLDFGPDVVLCPGDSFYYNANQYYAGTTYTWSNGDTLPVISTSIPGIYSLTISIGSCTTIDTIEISGQSNTGVLGNDTAICPGATLNLDASSNNAFSYSWNTGESGNIITVNTSGIYWVDIDYFNCIIRDSITVSNTSISNPIITGDTVLCIGGSGSISTSANYSSYIWSTGDSLSSINISQTGTYSVTIIESNGCSASNSIIVSNSSLNFSNVTIANITCTGTSDGSITVNATGGTAPYSYSWSNGSNSNSITGLQAGDYTVTISDANNCQKDTLLNIASGVILTLTATKTDITCNGLNNGTIDVSASGGTAPYSYNWSNGNSGSSISNLSAGDYTITITDANNCQKDTLLSIAEGSIIELSAVKTDISCYGLTDGSAIVTASGGALPYSYNWNNGASVNEINSVAAGSYSVTIADANNCNKDTTIVIENNTTEIEIVDFQITNASCSGRADGSIEIVNISGGTLPYSYEWDNGSNASTINSLLSGNYNLTIRDGNNCTKDTVFNISDGIVISLSAIITNITCAGSIDGSITINATGGTTPYSYNWSNGDNTNTVNNLNAASYSVTVSDVNSCFKDTTIVLNEGILIDLTLTVSDITCFGLNDGSANINAVGGTAPYSYNWSNGNSGSSILNLSADDYTVTVTDANNCQKDTLISIAEGSIIELSAVKTDINCYGLTDGSAIVTASGGALPYSYNWSSGVTVNEINSVAAGSYSVTITDANNCDKDTTIVIENNTTEIEIVDFQITNASCSGTADGSIEIINILGGTLPYSYEWDNGSNASTINGLLSGNYSLTIRDGNNCTKDTIFSITDGIVINSSATITNITCIGTSDGSITISTTGGTAPYSYNWSNGSNGNSITGLQAGDYTVTVSDANNCQKDTLLNIATGAIIALTATKTDITCNGLNNGIIDVSASGGTAPYSYNWSNGNSGNSISNLSTGDYTVTITDANNCQKDTLLSIVEGGIIELSAVKTNISCYGLTDGSIIVTASGGVLPYNYNWNNGVTENEINNVAEGAYSVTVVDQYGCLASITENIASPQQIILSISAERDTIDIGESVLISSSFNPEPTFAISYNWFPQSDIIGCADCSEIIVSPQSTTTYFLSVGNNCINEDSIVINVKADKALYIPNAFTPNGDGNNDEFKIFAKGVKTIYVNIYNRWGEKIFEFQNIKDGWDGTYLGREMPPGVYVYTVNVIFLNNQQEKKKGSFQLIR